MSKAYEANGASILALNSQVTSIFDLKAEESDFVSTLPLNEEMNAFLLSTRDMANEITERYDRKRKAEKEAKGQAWQNSRRGTKQATKDRRAAGERPIWAALSYAQAIYLIMTNASIDHIDGEVLYGLEEKVGELEALLESGINLQTAYEEALSVVDELGGTAKLDHTSPMEEAERNARVFLLSHLNDLPLGERS